MALTGQLGGPDDGQRNLVASWRDSTSLRLWSSVANDSESM